MISTRIYIRCSAIGCIALILVLFLYRQNTNFIPYVLPSLTSCCMEAFPFNLLHPSINFLLLSTTYPFPCSPFSLFILFPAHPFPCSPFSLFILFPAHPFPCSSFSLRTLFPAHPFPAHLFPCPSFSLLILFCVHPFPSHPFPFTSTLSPLEILLIVVSSPFFSWSSSLLPPSIFSFPCSLCQSVRGRMMGPQSPPSCNSIVPLGRKPLSCIWLEVVVFDLKL